MEMGMKSRLAASQSAVAKDVGQRIKEGRMAKGISQALLAAKLGLTRAAVTQWETGQSTCNYAQALELEKILDIDVCFLIFGRTSADDVFSANPADLPGDFTPPAPNH